MKGKYNLIKFLKGFQKKWQFIKDLLRGTISVYPFNVHLSNLFAY